MAALFRSAALLLSQYLFPRKTWRVVQGRPALWDAIQQPEEQGDDVETFADAPESDADEGSKPEINGVKEDATASTLAYDMQKRYSLCYLSCPICN